MFHRVGPGQQPTESPKPGPQHQKLQMWCGEWTYEVESHTTFLGPGAKFTGKRTGRLILNGFGAEFEFKDQTPSGEIETIEIDTYDPLTKSYPTISVVSDGSLFQGSFTINGNVATWEGITVVNGRHVKDRGTDTVAPDGMSYTMRGEISQDGKTWVPSFIVRATKVKAAGK
jgi:hypothetical protein